MNPSWPSQDPCFALKGPLFTIIETLVQPPVNPSAACRLEGVDYVSTFQELRTKHEQNKEVVPNAFAT